MDLTDHDVAHEIAERIRTLIARQDHGDVTAAARRLDRPIADVYLPERILASGGEPARDFLASIVRTYQADACWLITGFAPDSTGQISSDAGTTIAAVLGELSDRLLHEARHERTATSSA